MYTVNNIDLANLRAEAFDVKLKYFVATKTTGSSPSPISSSDLALATASYGCFDNVNFAFSSCGMDGIYARNANYREIEVPFNGDFSEELSDNAISWSVNLQDIPQQSYQPKVNDNILCFRKIINKNSLYEYVYHYDDFEDGYNGVNLYNSTASYQNYLNTPYIIQDNGKYGKCAYSAPAASNYCTNPSYETSATGFTANYRSIGERTDDLAYSGSYSMRVTTASGGQNFQAIVASEVLANSTTYTVSSYFWNSASNSNKINLVLTELYNSSASSVSYLSQKTTASGWNRYSYTFTTKPNHSSLYVYINGASNCGNGEIYYADAIQIEKNSEPTPYFDGSLGSGYAWSGTQHATSSSRGSSRIVLPTLNSQPISSNGTIAFWGNLQSVSGSKTLWNMSNILHGYVSASRVYFANAANVGAYSNASTGWHHYAFTWDSTRNERRVYIDGNLASQNNYATPGSTSIALGYDSLGGGSFANCGFDEFLVFGKTISACQIYSIYNRGRAEYVGNDWHLWWNGIVTDVTGNINYAEDRRNISVKNVESLLENYNSPRITVNTKNIARDASVEVSSTLMTPEVEIKNGEFYKALINADSSNMVDDRIDTVWISQDPPLSGIETTVLRDFGDLIIDEFFCSPIPGWDDKLVWWIEILNTSQSHKHYFGRDGVTVTAYNSNGDCVMLDFLEKTGDGNRWEDSQWEIPEGERMIICSDKELFEAYTGGAPQADFIIEAKTFNPKWDFEPGSFHNSNNQPIFNLRRKGGFICILYPTGYTWLGGKYVADVVCWGNDIHGRDMTKSLPGYISLTNDWKDTTSLSTVSDGYSYRRKPSGTDTNYKSDWFAEQYPKPGNKLGDGIFEWAKIELKDNETTLTADHAVGSTQLLCDTLVGWPISGGIILEGEYFTYSNRTDTVIYINGALDNSHISGARVYPTNDDGAAMTGWKLESVWVERKANLSTIKIYCILTSKYGGASTPNDDPLWENDYEQKLSFGTNYRQNAIRGLIDKNGNPLWVKTIMVVIREMSDKGRAKINNIRANLSVGSVNSNILESENGRTAYNIINFILNNYSDYKVGTKNNVGESWGGIGDLQLAIGKIPDAINGVAEVSGCWIKYNLDNTIDIIKNPWWPGGLSENIINLTNADVRDYIEYNDKKVEVTGVTLSGFKVDGTPLSPVTVPPSASGLGVIEYSDISVADESQQTALAWNLYYKEKYNRTATLKLKGVGSGISVGQRINLSINGTNYGSFIVDSVNTSWNNSGDYKNWETNLGVRKYF